MSANEDDGWDKDSDEIRSLDSEYLHEARPNRWTGAEATWRDLTAEDRQAHAALVGERNRDLGVHLYNAFGLKRHGLSGEQAGVEEEEDEDEDKAWTAWPMRLEDVPAEDFTRTGELHDTETLCRPCTGNPAGELEEEISAAILRLAKERFRKRQEQTALVEAEGGQDSMPADPNVEPSIEVGPEQHAEDEVMEMELDDTGSDSHSEDGDGDHTRGIKAAISADDDASYAMLQPSARHILSQLDRTLTILHNTRMAMFSYLSDSDAEDDEINTVSHAKRKRTPEDNQTDAERQAGRRRLGRPPKPQVPREGETEREMLIRIAREKKKRLPVFSDEENDTPASDSKSQGRRRKSQRKPRQEPNVQQDAGREGPEARPDEGEHPKEPADDPERRFDKLGLRDWKDVLGAAAMAGFSSKVIARASQRCANLFEQRIEFKTLAEYPAAHGTRRMHTARYRPGGEISSDEEIDEEEAAMTEVEQRRAVSRASSVAVGSSEEEEEGKMTRKPGTKKRNEMTSVGQLYCPYPGCSRSVQGFNRKGNLNRHLDTMHGKDSTLEHMNTANEDHSNDVHGAVHVDGFLKPIKVQKGWREGDTKLRPRRPNNGERRRSRGATPPPDDGYTAEQGEDELPKYESQDDEYV